MNTCLNFNCITILVCCLLNEKNSTQNAWSKDLVFKNPFCLTPRIQVIQFKFNLYKSSKMRAKGTLNKRNSSWKDGNLC